jgi:hypothetical protein
VGLNSDVDVDVDAAEEVGLNNVDDAEEEGHVAASKRVDDGDAAPAAHVGEGAEEASNCWPGDQELSAKFASGGLGRNKLRSRQTPLIGQVVAVVQRWDRWKSWGRTRLSGSAVAAPFELQLPLPFGTLPARLWHSPPSYLEFPYLLHLVAGEQVPNASDVVELELAQVDPTENRILYSDKQDWAEFSIGRPELLVCSLRLSPIRGPMDYG